MKNPGQTSLRLCAFASLRLIPLFALLAGCAGVSKNTGFDDVKAMTQARIGAEVQWNRDSADDQRLRELVKAKLTEPLTPESAVQIALLNNHRLQAIYQNLGIARAEVIEAGLLRNPVLAGNVKPSLGGGGTELEIGMAQEFIGALTIPLRKGIAQAEFEAVKLEATRQILALAAEVRGQYFVVQANEQILESHRQMVAVAEAGLEAARRLHEAGNIRDLDLDNEAARLSEAKLDLAAAEITTRKNQERLNILMGLWGEDASLKFSGSLPEIPADEITGEEIEKRVVEKNLELAALKLRISALAQNVGLTQTTALVPEVDLGASFKRETDGRNLLGPAFSFPIPFFNRGQGRITHAKAELRREQEEFYYKAVETRAAARAAWDHLQLARARAIQSRDVALPLKKKILDESQLEYNAMQIGVFDLLTAKRNQIEAERRSDEDLRDYWLTRTEMESLLSGHVTAVGFETTALDKTMGSALH